MKVIALDTYTRLKIKDGELNRMPTEGEILEVTKERFDVLNGNNIYNEIFVKEYREEVETTSNNSNAEKIKNTNRK